MKTLIALIITAILLSGCTMMEPPPYEEWPDHGGESF
jgi:PBP1b-binding outer membrane lipoprotein LpoB